MDRDFGMWQGIAITAFVIFNPLSLFMIALIVDIARGGSRMLNLIRWLFGDDAP